MQKIDEFQIPFFKINFWGWQTRIHKKNDDDVITKLKNKIKLVHIIKS
jgi:hypothetical protein